MVLVTLSAAVSVYASCSNFGPGASDTLSGQFTFAALDDSTGIVSPLHLLITEIVPKAAYHVLSVRTSWHSHFELSYSLSG